MRLTHGIAEPNIVCSCGRTQSIHTRARTHMHARIHAPTRKQAHTARPEDVRRCIRLVPRPDGTGEAWRYAAYQPNAHVMQAHRVRFGSVYQDAQGDARGEGEAEQRLVPLAGIPASTNKLGVLDYPDARGSGTHTEGRGARGEERAE